MFAGHIKVLGGPHVARKAKRVAHTWSTATHMKLCAALAYASTGL